MRRVALSVVYTLAIMYAVTFLIYGSFSVILGLEPPAEASPWRFLFSIFVVKVGLSVAFVLLYYLGLKAWARSWLLYAFIWWLMFVFGEIGQAIGPGYSWTEAVAGIIAEIIYCPLAAFVVARVLSRGIDLSDDSAKSPPQRAGAAPLLEEDCGD